ncbi:SpoIIE family protein phosphatase [Streptomyces sp. NPDC020917]|uniref:SpoIIE family protein phosphatase n=1 Tax=Streptomyces sp. NPDC020917 TaxID=3365102 RepID=UPI0037BDF852
MYAVDLARTPWWELNQSVLERFLTDLPYGIAVLDHDLRYMWLNHTLESMAGVSMSQRLGRRITEVLPRLAPNAMEDQLRNALTSGIPIRGYEYRGHVPADTEHQRAYSTSFFRLDDDEGRVLGVGYMGTDVTERKRAQDGLLFLTRAGTLIGRTLDITRTAEELAETAVPHLADLVTVDLFPMVLAGDEPGPVTPAGALSLMRVAHHSRREGCPEAAVPIGAPSGFSTDSPIARCMTEGRTVLDRAMEPPLGQWYAHDVVRSELAQEFGLRSVIAVPLIARGACLGAVLLLRGSGSERFEPSDIPLAEEFVSRAALCLDNARRYAREHTAAEALQRSLLSRPPAGSGALDIATRYLPAQTAAGVAGDWFDVIPLSGARMALVVGDVVGRGINAAAAMGRLRLAVRTLASTDPAPAELLAHLDDLVLRLLEERPVADNGQAAATSLLGASCLYAVYDPVTRRCTVASAGHPAPVVAGPSGEMVPVALPSGPPLGLGTLPFEAADVDVPDGSVLALFTKGLLSAYDGEHVPGDGSDSASGGTDAALLRLHDAVRRQPDGSLDSVCDELVAAMPARPRSDDVALLVARAHGLGPDQVSTWDLPQDPAVVGQARTCCTDTLRIWGLDALDFTTELIVSELVTNAIRHAVGPIRLRLIRHASLICEVTDASSTSPRLRHARTTDEGGRGLFLVARMARRWGTRYTAEGKVIWAEQQLPMD